MLAHAYNIIIDHGFLSTRNGREVVGVLNTKYKRFILMLIKVFNLPFLLGMAHRW